MRIQSSHVTVSNRFAQRTRQTSDVPSHDSTRRDLLRNGGAAALLLLVPPSLIASQKGIAEAQSTQSTSLTALPAPVAANQTVTYTAGTNFLTQAGEMSLQGPEGETEDNLPGTGLVTMLRDQEVRVQAELGPSEFGSGKLFKKITLRLGPLLGTRQFLYQNGSLTFKNGGAIPFDSTGVYTGKGYRIVMNNNPFLANYTVQTKEYEIDLDEQSFIPPFLSNATVLSFHTGAGGVLEDGVQPTGYAGRLFDRDRLPY